MKMVSRFEDLDIDVKKLLKEIRSREDNLKFSAELQVEMGRNPYLVEIEFRPDEMIEIATNPLVDLEEDSEIRDLAPIDYIDDYKVVKEIDALPLSSPKKLLVYAFYNPDLLSFEETVELVNSLSEVNEANYHRKPDEVKESVIRKLWMKSNSESALFPDQLTSRSRYLREISRLLFGSEKDYEGLDNLILLNKFLAEGEGEETFNEFYGRDENQGLLELENMMPLFQVYRESPETDLSALFDLFRVEAIGSMGGGIKEETKDRLKKLPKFMYQRVIRDGMRARPEVRGVELRVLEELLNFYETSEEGEAKDLLRSQRNHDAFLRLLIKKESEWERRLYGVRLKDYEDI